MIRRLANSSIQDDAARFLPEAGERRSAVADESTDVAAYGAGYKDGFEAGEADGLREALTHANRLEAELRQKYEETESSLQNERKRLTSLISGLVASEAARASQCEMAAFEIALLCLSRAFGERDGDQELLRRVTSSLVAEFRADALRIQVAEDDRAMLPERIDGLDVEVRSDLPSGSCALVTTKGTAETSVAERLATICESMIEAMAATGS